MNRERKRFLAGLYRAALAAVEPERAVSRALADPRIARLRREARRVGVFAVGKAAAAMFRGVSDRYDSALVVVPRGYPAPEASRAEIREASHPEPDRSSVAAARRAIAFFSEFREGDVILCLVSGGSSSLLCLPRPGLTLARKRRRVRELARSGASILQLNRLRTSLSAVKGGGLGRSTRATLVTFVLSDVPGDRPSAVGSGPTIRNDRRDVVRVVGSNRMGLSAAASRARSQGLRPRVLARSLSGEAVSAGGRIARIASSLAPGTVLLAGGETTVELTKRAGKGGRALELALAAAAAFGAASVDLLSAGSDGIDGTSRAAGAFADTTTVPRARSLGLSLEDALSRHDSEPFFDALGDLFVTGPTGTNVADWVFARRHET